MKQFLSHIILLSLISVAHSQETTMPAIKFELSGGSSGGSFYDVPRKFEDFDKYGKERLSPSGFYLKGILENDEFGKVYFRKIDVVRREDKTELGTQNVLRYESPLITLKNGKYFNYFVKGDVINYSQKNHFIYFKADGDHTPDLDQNLSLLDHYRTNQRQTYIAPSLGICNSQNFSKGDFDFNTFASMALTPIGYLNYETNISENKMSSPDTKLENKSGNSFAMGAEAVIEGVIKYKNRYYFKIRFEQNVFAGIDKDRNLASNRTTNYELGYLITDHLSININVENNELILLNEDRHAIDVFNNTGLGIKYKIPYRKR